jgi:hypothetical protein
VTVAEIDAQHFIAHARAARRDIDTHGGYGARACQATVLFEFRASTTATVGGPHRFVMLSNTSALIGLGLQTAAAVWLVKLELRKGHVEDQRQRHIDALRHAIKDRERLIDEVIVETKATNARLAQGAPKGQPDRYSLEEAVASYRQQIDGLARNKEDLRDAFTTEESPALGLVGAIILIIVGALLQVPLLLK